MAPSRRLHVLYPEAFSAAQFDLFRALDRSEVCNASNERRVDAGLEARVRGLALDDALGMVPSTAHREIQEGITESVTGEATTSLRRPELRIPVGFGAQAKDIRRKSDKVSPHYRT